MSGFLIDALVEVVFDAYDRWRKRRRQRKEKS